MFQYIPSALHTSAEITLIMILAHLCVTTVTTRSIIMVDYREILRLRSLSCSNVIIVSSVNSSRNTVREVLSIAQALKMRWPLTDDVINQTLQSMLYPRRTKQDKIRLIMDGIYIYSCIITMIWYKRF